MEEFETIRFLWSFQTLFQQNLSDFSSKRLFWNAGSFNQEISGFIKSQKSAKIVQR